MLSFILYTIVFRYIIENFFDLVISFVMEIKTLESDVRNSILALSSVIFCLLILFWIFIIIFINSKFQKVIMPSSKLNSLVMGLNLNSSLYFTIYFLSFFSVRILVGLLIFLTDKIDSLYLWMILLAY